MTVMHRTLHCIALRTIKYNERHSILSAYSLETGKVSFLIPAGAGREAARRRALLMPLGLFECEAHLRHGQELYTMSQPRAEVALHGIHAHPVKSALAMFVAEVLGVVVRDSGPDELLYEFLRQSIERLNDASVSVANFHICFLYRLGRFIGIEPDVTTYEPGRVFDMVDGTFRLTAPMHQHFLSPDESAVLAKLSRITFDNMHLYRFNRDNRRQLLAQMLEYYTLHYASLSSLKSLDVLTALFD